MWPQQNPKFKFKKFDVSHGQSSMKVGTDAVLLGTWVEVEGCSKALDVGTGTGVISLILAQRFPQLIIDAIDIHSESIEEAQFNFEASPWNNRLSAEHISLQNKDVTATHFDLVISNPPFFEAGNLSPIEERSKARHTKTLDYNTLITTSSKLLTDGGLFAVVLPFSVEGKFSEKCNANGLRLWRRLAFQPKGDKPPERILLQFRKSNTVPLEADEVLIHYNSDGTWTDGYKNLTRDFYLKI